MTVRQLRQLKPDGAPVWAFWWESNNCWGWIASEEDWDHVRQIYRDVAPSVDLLRARVAEWDHPASIVSGVPRNLSFGFRREHTGGRLTLWDHALAHGLNWMLPASVAKQERSPNFRDEHGRLFLVRCFQCDPDRGRENWAPAVASGQCAWCGWTEKREDEKTT